MCTGIWKELHDNTRMKSFCFMSTRFRTFRDFPEVKACVLVVAYLEVYLQEAQLRQWSDETGRRKILIVLLN